MSLTVSAAYEVLLRTTGLSDYVLNAPRVDLFSANRYVLCECVPNPPRVDHLSEKPIYACVI